MKITTRWLGEYVEHDLDAEELAERLTLAGLETEPPVDLGERYRSLRVARVIEVARHPGADRLSVCKVDAGEGVVPVVCGAPNVRADATVAFAPVGSRLPDGTAIRKAKLRGETSEGMILSAAELGFEASSDGILLLDDERLEIGASLAEALDLDDWLLEIDLTPNRADCLGVLGIAREVAALTGAELRLPEVTVEEGDEAVEAACSVRIDDTSGCHRYAARVLRGVTVGPSPLDVIARLAAVGQRSISNVVDATNLVLMELGHPLHAFDLARLAGQQIVVRAAGAGEALETLDGQRRQLDADDLVIADAKRAVALAGVMGGADSGVVAGSSDLLLESAWFDPLRVRRTARRLSMHTEASHRFERGADPVGLGFALERLAHVIQRLAGGSAARGVLDVVARPYEARVVSFRPARATRVLGFDVDAAEQRGMLERLGASVREGDSPASLEVEIPSHRGDLTREADLIEEVARLWGLDRIPAHAPSGAVSEPAPGGARPVEERVRDLLVGQGVDEAVTLAFGSRTGIEAFRHPDGRAEPVTVANPLGEETATLMTSLLPGLLPALRENLNHRAERVRLFEVASVFRRAGGRWPYREVPSVAVVLAGPVGTGPFAESNREVDFFDLKGILENLLEGLGITGVEFVASSTIPCFEPTEAAELLVAGNKVGELGRLESGLARSFDLEKTVYAFEVELDALATPPPARFQRFVRQPLALRDVALVVDEGVPVAELLPHLEAGKWVERVTLFDVYRGDKVGAGRKSLAFRLAFRHPERSLTEPEIASAVERILESARERLDVTLRE